MMGLLGIMATLLCACGGARAEEGVIVEAGQQNATGPGALIMHWHGSVGAFCGRRVPPYSMVRTLKRLHASIDNLGQTVCAVRRRAPV